MTVVVMLAACIALVASVAFTVHSVIGYMNTGDRDNQNMYQLRAYQGALAATVLSLILFAFRDAQIETQHRIDMMEMKLQCERANEDQPPREDRGPVHAGSDN